MSHGHDEFRCVPVLTSRSVVETIISIRLKARRCDCSFVFAVPVQTSVGKFKSNDVLPLQKPRVYAAETLGSGL